MFLKSTYQSNKQEEVGLKIVVFSVWSKVKNPSAQ